MIWFVWLGAASGHKDKTIECSIQIFLLHSHESFSAVHAGNPKQLMHLRWWPRLRHQAQCWCWWSAWQSQTGCEGQWGVCGSSSETYPRSWNLLHKESYGWWCAESEKKNWITAQNWQDHFSYYTCSHWNQDLATIKIAGPSNSSPSREAS